MKLFPVHFSSGLRDFVLNYCKTIFFTTLFYSLWLLAFYLDDYDLELKHFAGRMIGSATLHAIDISLRVSLFYKAIGLLFFSIFILNGLGYALYKLNKNILRSIEMRLLNYCSLGGLVYYLFILFGYKVDNSIEFIYFLHKLMIGALIIKLYFKTELSISVYVILLSLATALYFIISDFFILASGSEMPDFLIYTFVITLLLIIFLHLKIRNKNIPQQREFTLQMAFVFVPFSFAPFLSVLKDEIQLILIGQGYAFDNSIFIYTILILSVSLFVYFRFIKIKNKGLGQKHLTLNTIISRQYFPILIFSLIAYTLYHPFMNDSIEMSESANRYLPIMEFKNWGIVPMFEKLNSHLLSDIFFSSIYALFNNFKGNEIELYDFLYGSIIGLLYYYLVYFISRNAYVALFVVLFYPFFPEILPDGHAIAVLSIFFLFRIIEQKASLKNYLYLLFGALFLVFCRIDIGTACLPIMCLILVLYPAFMPGVRYDLKKLFSAVVIVVSSILLILFSLSIYRNINLIEKAKNALNYFSSAQTYGYIHIGNTTQQSYTLHYFLFPVIAAILMILLLYRFRSLNISSKQRLAYISLLVLAGYYFVNFQRGLIRHSLLEGNDTFVSSFIYIFIAGSVYLFFFKTSQVFKFILFNGLLFFLTINYKCPPPSLDSVTVFERTFKKIESYQLPILKPGDSRSINFDQKQYHNIISFLKNNLDTNQTFIDFTNTPMLFYFTNKITPSYFYQNPICSHNDYLQNVFIEDLKTYNAPYLLFSRLIDQENTIDGVPNCLRHYRMAEYFYSHYEPFVIKDQYCVWKKIGLTSNPNNRVIFSLSKNNTDSMDWYDTLRKTFTVKANKKYLVQLNGHQTIDPTSLKAYSNNSELAVHCHFTTFNSNAAYCEFEPQGSSFTIQLGDLDNIREIKVTECESFPDYRSTKYISYEVFQLPHIWGTYDKAYKSETVLFEDKTNTSLKQTESLNLNFPSTIDRSSGNTIVLAIRNTSDKIQKAHLSFSKTKGLAEGTLVFDLLPSLKTELYAIRVSSFYNWYKKGIDQLTLNTESDSEIQITNIKITKGQ